MPRPKKSPRKTPEKVAQSSDDEEVVTEVRFSGASDPAPSSSESAKSTSNRKKRLSVGFALSNPRRSSVGDAPPPEVVMEENDDEAEKMERKKSREGSTDSSSRRKSIGGKDKRLSIAPTEDQRNRKKMLSNAQLSELYSSCIRLSTENKINEKNTWDLNLIDYSTDVLVAKQLEENAENANFQAAGTTLDAMSKIYSTRVDSVYSNIYKVLGGLNRQAEGGDAEEEGEKGEGEKDQAETAASAREAEEEDEVKAQKRKHRQMNGGSTLDTVENITLTKFDTEFQVDPLFKKTSASFDEPGARGLLLNRLNVYENCQIVFDSTDAQRGKKNKNNEEDTTCDITALQAKLNKLDVSTMQICPTFVNFSFNVEKKKDEDADAMINEFNAIESFEDINIEADIVAQYDEDEADMGRDVQLENMLADHDDDDDHFGLIDLRPNNVVVDGGDGEGNQEAPAHEFAFFDADKMENWAGPAHWKFKPGKSVPKVTQSDRPADLGGDGLVVDEEKKEKKRARKKEPFFLDFEHYEEPDEALFEPSKAPTTMPVKKQTTQLNNVLPSDLRYDAKLLTHLFTKTDVKVSTARGMLSQAPARESIVDGANNGEYEDENDNDLLQDNGNFDDGFFETHLPGDQDDVEKPLDLAEFGEFNFPGKLVEEPEKVEQIRVNYATAAKLVDIKALKDSIWSSVEKMEEEEMEFKELVADLPMMKKDNNVTVPFCFICLLHLANEKGLDIVQEKNDLKDLRIKMKMSRADAETHCSSNNHLSIHLESNNWFRGVVGYHICLTRIGSPPLQDSSSVDCLISSLRDRVRGRNVKLYWELEFPYPCSCAPLVEESESQALYNGGLRHAPPSSSCAYSEYVSHSEEARYPSTRSLRSVHPEVKRHIKNPMEPTTVT
ncbi:condensin complex subunit 2-like [Planoprotostelium fungivorum]|uniref:Condensin complex subunit 2 n=1 Tax=Planoprotostelium fungivorum TaxID=1890364 RepID=A0A2P6NZH8_9EUKA|nr:condensin complex subunit 2-like [Planoprotostelium fungivorum]